MVIEHTVDVFERNAHIHEIAIVSNAMLIADIENIVLKNGWTKVKRILKGGNERYESSLSAIKAYENEPVNLIFHDAVRPLVSQRILNDVVDALQSYSAIDVAMPSADTIIEVDGDFISHIPDRSRLRRGQNTASFRARSHQRGLRKGTARPQLQDHRRLRSGEKIPAANAHLRCRRRRKQHETYLQGRHLHARQAFSAAQQRGRTHRPLPKSRLQERWPFVFGGSYGIGADTAKMLTERGAKVHCFSRSSNGIDVGNKEDVERVFAEGGERSKDE